MSYQVFFDAVLEIETDLPIGTDAEVEKRCVKADELLDEIESLLELYGPDMALHEKGYKLRLRRYSNYPKRRCNGMSYLLREHQGTGGDGAAQAPCPHEVIQYLCPCCGIMVPDARGLRAADGIDPGTTLTCPECQADTVVDLFSPEERRAMYVASQRMTLCPTFALAVTLEGEAEATTLARARDKVTRWLNEVAG